MSFGVKSSLGTLHASSSSVKTDEEGNGAFGRGAFVLVGAEHETR